MRAYLNRLLPFFRPIVAIVALGLILPRISHACTGEPTCESSQIKVVVRTIQASGTRAALASGTSDQAAPPLEEALSDLKPKLDLLPFSSFRLIASKEERISLKKKEHVRLPNGQTLSFRPMYMDKERVGMWLSWKDTDGSNILDTRIHFDADESVLTGADYHDNEGRILAIRAARVK